MGTQMNADGGWISNPDKSFLVRRAELRKFDNMMAYYRQADWAAFTF
jgi:hypothetical protein